MDVICQDDIIRIISFLTVKEVGRVSCASNHVHKIVSPSIYLWRDICLNSARGNVQLVESLVKHIGLYRSMQDIKCEVYHTAARCLNAMMELKQLSWGKIQLVSKSLLPLDRMEGHTINVLLDRFAIVVGGWGPKKKNNLYAIDGLALPSLVTIPFNTLSCPRFRYGFSTVSVPPISPDMIDHSDDVKRLSTYFLLYGGCTTGGYSGDCNDLFRIDFSIELNQQFDFPFPFDQNPQRLPIGSIRNLTASYSKLSRNTLDVTTSSIIPITRGKLTTLPCKPFINKLIYSVGYHSACVVDIDGDSSMVVFGGLHNNAPTAELEILNIRTNSWRKGNFSGQQPSPRFGHSCLYIKSSNIMIFSGGSNGSDLLRDGEELTDIFLLRIIRSQTSNEPDQMIWSMISYNNESLSPYPFPGRCHTATSVGSKIIYFGGGAKNSNTTIIADISTILLDIKTADLDESSDHTYNVEFTVPSITTKSGVIISPPRPRVSHVSAHIGRYMIMFGGWSNLNSELNDIWLLDLAFESSDEYLEINSANNSKSVVVDAKASEDWYILNSYLDMIKGDADDDGVQEVEVRPNPINANFYMVQQLLSVSLFAY
eukprot:gene13960-18724_t